MFPFRFLSLLLACLLLSSCVVTEQDLQMQRDLLEMKRRLGEAERALKELQDDTSGGVRAHVETLARNQADFQAELDGVRVDLQSMQGRTGDQEFEFRWLIAHRSLAPHIAALLVMSIASGTTRLAEAPVPITRSRP